jgi:transposase
MAGFAGAIPAVPDLPSTLPRVGPGRGLRKSTAGSGEGREGTRQAGFDRVFHRWQLCHRKKGGRGVGKTKRGKGTKLMAVADRAGLPIAISVESASPHEVRLVESTLKSRFTKERPEKLIGDRAYDSDPLDERLRKQGIELIAPHKTNRKKPRTQDGRPLRRYRNRWKIERLFAWLQNFRRIQTRHERILENYLAFVLLGCMIILFRSCF